MQPYPEMVSFVDWDFLRKPLIILKIDENKNLPFGQKELVVQRDSDYNLSAFLFFEDRDFLKEYLTQKNEVIAGGVVDGFQIKGITEDNAGVTLENCHKNGFCSNANERHSFRFTINFNEIKIHYPEKTATRLREWFLNGPKNSTSIDSLSGTILHQCSKEQFLSKTHNDFTIGHSFASYSHHYLWCQLKDYRFLVTNVPKEGPEWSTNIQIEYHKDWGKIPEEDERLRIEELCSFVFGKHMLSLGYTMYDCNEDVVEVSAHSPWGHDAKKSCSQAEYPPVRFSVFPPGDSERLLNFLMPRYIELSTLLDLSDALWNYWISLDVPVGINLAIISSSIETVIQSWLKSNKSVSRGLFLKPEVFQELMGDILLDLEIKSKAYENGDKMFDAVKRSNSCGIMESYRIFFKEIKLPIRPEEWDAIKGRHHFVHGQAHFQKEDWLRIIPQVNALQTLFNRAMLKIMGYNGSYIDRSTQGWPDAQI